MPNRPNKIKRPSWNLEPDYHRREAARLALVANIRKRSTLFIETALICEGCDRHIWEARLPGDVRWAGCHCLTFQFPPGLKEHPLSLEFWNQIVSQGNAVLAWSSRQAASRN